MGMILRITIRLLFLAVIIVLHAVGQFLLYRQRVTSKNSFFYSDIVVFYLPAVIAIALYFFALRIRLGSRSKMRVWLVLGCSMGLTFLSNGLGMIAALNTYGS
jgi:hypothetical protein